MKLLQMQLACSDCQVPHICLNKWHCVASADTAIDDIKDTSQLTAAPNQHILVAINNTRS
jgi:hypothetical protein